MSSPLISVVMPVHNARPFLAESIGSILNQTLADFEFVILDDGSTDGSSEVVRQWARKDSRIQVYESRQRLGLSGSSNLVVSKCRGQIIARMDADDISDRDRLRRQWQIMRVRSDIVALGTLCIGIDTAGRAVRPRDRWRLVRKSTYVPFPHGSVMFRKTAFDAVGGYHEGINGGEDQDLFLRMAKKGRVATLPDMLYRYRYHSNNATLTISTETVKHDYSQNGHNLSAFYMLGAMQLWAGNQPTILRPLVEKGFRKWNVQTLVTLVSAGWGSVHPTSLRFVLRSLIRARDFLGGLWVREGKPYEWRLE